MKHFVSAILLIIIFIGCNTKSKNGEPAAVKSDSSAVSKNSDTTVSFSIAGQNKSITVKKSADLNNGLKKFQKFLNDFSDKPKALKWKNEIQADLKGDGKKRKIKTTITIRRDTCFVLKEVYNEHGELFWSYRHFYSEMKPNWFLGTESSYKELKPYSMFYLGYQSRQFDTISPNQTLKDAFQKKMESIAVLKNPNDNSELEGIKEYIKKFKGKSLKSYEVTNNEKLVYFYYEPYNSFIAVSPEENAIVKK